MPESDHWLTRYEESHRDLRYPILFGLSVVMVVLGTVGLLWTLPVPDAFVEISPFLNWGSAFVMATAVYYFIISVPLAIGMLPFLLGVAGIQVWLGFSGYVPVRVAGAFLLAGTIGLWLGHRHPNGLRALISDLQLMMIGPLWALSTLYRRIGIPT